MEGEKRAELERSEREYEGEMLENELKCERGLILAKARCEMVVISKVDKEIFGSIARKGTLT